MKKRRPCSSIATVSSIIEEFGATQIPAIVENLLNNLAKYFGACFLLTCKSSRAES